MSRRTLATILLAIASMLLAIALFLAGAKWRALATSSGSGTQAPLLGIDATLARALRSRLAEILGVLAPEADALSAVRSIGRVPT